LFTASVGFAAQKQVSAWQIWDFTVKRDRSSARALALQGWLGKQVRLVHLLRVGWT
jgi:hypothetical protein